MAELTSWEGDFDELHALRDRLADEPDSCERIFASKHEALLAGMYIAAEKQRDGGSASVDGVV